MTDERRRDDVVPADHPCLAGHFPGNPIVPGVVLVERVLDAMRDEVGRPLSGIPNVKFLHPLRPGTVFTICWSLQADGARFRCESSSADGAPVLHVQGVLSFRNDAG